MPLHRPQPATAPAATFDINVTKQALKWLYSEVAKNDPSGTSVANVGAPAKQTKRTRARPARKDPEVNAEDLASVESEDESLLPTKLEVLHATRVTGTQSRMTTRASNAQKHPGYALLDGEDMKKCRQKDQAAEARCVKAKKKEQQKLLLEAGKEKIAAHESRLLAQTTDKARNAPELVAKTESTSKKHSDYEDEPNGSEFELPVKDNSASVSSDTEASDKENIPPSSRAARGKKHRPVREIIEDLRKDVEPNTGKCNINDDHGAKFDTSLLSTMLYSSRKKAEISTLSNNLKNPEFNDHYGGIMDDEIQEIPPPSIKTTQVKITTRISHNAPRVKVEALNPGLRGPQAPSKKDRSYMSLELTSQDLLHFKSLVIPAFRSVIGATPYPWDNSNPEFLDEFCLIWAMVIPGVEHKIQADGKEYQLAIQRVTEYCNSIAGAVRRAVEVHLMDTCGNAPTVIQDYIEHLIGENKARYMWLKNDSDNPLDFSGLFLPPYIVTGITAHLELTMGLLTELQVLEHPRGALALATVAAERALKAWRTGQDMMGKDHGRREEEKFLKTLWGAVTRAVMGAVERVSEKKWAKILAEAEEGINRMKLPVKVKVETDDARRLALRQTVIRLRYTDS
ncbi:hypothetical protein H0H92_009586 [Tricholoma furcatifolium]|nr:hypothetical protein H0H92_009586 [Tricholoma furcatifolium]